MSDTTIWQNLRTLFESVAPMLERPAVQRQIIAFLLVTFLAWLAPRWGRRWSQWVGRTLRTREAPSERARHTLTRRLLRALTQTYFPLLGIVLVALTIQYFHARGWLVGLLEQSQRLFLLLLIYRVLVALLYIVLTEARAYTYQRRFLTPLVIIAILIGLNQVLAGVVSLGDIHLSIVAERPITISTLFLASVVFYLFLVVSWLTRDILTNTVLPRVNIEPGIANTILTVSQYVILSTGILAFLSALGIDLSTLAIIGAGLSVGIGFGLQELVANFISGILLLFEQSIRPGDVIQINDQIGTVDRLRIRSTTIRTRENAEIIIPNQNLLTSAVTTYTHRDRLIRLNIPVGASYGSEPSNVRDALLSAAGRHGLVKKQPAPIVFFDGYGDSSIDFALAVWIENAELTRSVCSDLRFIIWEELKKRNIEIPFPQRDVHIRSGLDLGALVITEKGEEVS